MTAARMPVMLSKAAACAPNQHTDSDILPETAL